MMSEDAEALPGREERTAGIALTAWGGYGRGTLISLSPLLAPHPRSDSSFALLANKLTKPHQYAFR